MNKANTFSGTGRGLLLVGGVAVMAISLALAEFGAQTQAQTKAAPRQDEPAPAGRAAQRPRQPAERAPAGERRGEERQPTDRQPNERQPRERQTDARSGEDRDRRDADQPAEPESLGLKVAGEGEAGLTVSAVEPESLAARAGLRPNDKIVSVDGRPIRSGRRLMAYLSGRDGRRVPLVIEREGRQMTVQLVTTRSSQDVAWLGVFLEQGDDESKGAKITHIYPAGPAARAGLRSGDVILSVNGEECVECAGLIETVEKKKPGEKIELVVLRGDNEVKLNASLANRSHFVASGPRELEAGEGDQWADQHDHDDFYDIPEHAMELEAHRRLAEQHERIESLIQQLRGEVQALREELKTRR